jgi:glyoxylase-like metal-dependent hydrolase (beta-lactamase superfamily II)
MKLKLALIAALGCLSPLAFAQQAADEKLGTVVLASQDGKWDIRSLGKDVYVFRWNPDFYQSLFVVAPREVLVVDPLGPVAAPYYREAVRRITSAPITKIVYSHSHRDHSGGARELAPGAEILAHVKAKDRILARGDKDVPVPTRTVADGDVIRVGTKRIHVHYFGPTHSDSLIALTVDTGIGKLLMFVDAIEPGIPPYRNMGEDSVDGGIAALERAARLNVDAVMGGHTGPAPGIWVARYRDYLKDLLAATRVAWASADTAPRPGEDGIRANERIIAAVTRAAAASIRSKYSDWRGYDIWAPMNAERMLVYIQTGD